MKILVSFSGGKDSQACLIQAAKQYGVDKIEAVFCDTGWEHPDTYQHITDVCSQMGVKLITLKSKFDFVSLAKYKKRFPATTTRFCTEELKIKPMIDYVLSLDDSCIIIQGIRSAESASRAAMEEECMYFKTEMNQMSIGAFKYWLRIHGFHLNQFGTGEKWNPINIKSKKSKQ